MIGGSVSRRSDGIRVSRMGGDEIDVKMGEAVELWMWNCVVERWGMKVVRMCAFERLGGGRRHGE